MNVVSFTNLEESTPEHIPFTLQEVISKLRERSFSEKDLFNVLVLYIMFESNFHIPGEESIDITDHIISVLNIDTSMNETFILNGFEDISLKIMTNYLDTFVLVNAILDDSNEMFSLCLPLNKYILPVNDSDYKTVFKDLKDFSFNFKNKIISPLKCCILKQYRYPSASLVGIPDELLLKICLLLPVEDALSVAKTCHKMNNFLNEERFWFLLCKRDYPNENVHENTWREIYKRLYLLEKHQRRHLDVSSSEQLHNITFDSFSFFDNPRWDISL